MGWTHFGDFGPNLIRILNFGLLSRASLAGRNFFVSGRSIANPDIFEKYSVQFIHFWAYLRSSSKSGSPKVGSKLVEYG